MYPLFLQTLEKTKLYLQQWKHNRCDIFVNRRYVHGFKTIIFCYGECRGKSFQPNIFHVLLLLWLRCPKSSLKSPYWCCQSNSCERKDALS